MGDVVSVIFCVEDDPAIRESILYALEATRFEPEGFANGETFFAQLKRKVQT